MLPDLKASGSSSLKQYVGIEQPLWPNEAERIVHLQDRLQQVYPKMLDALKIKGTPYVMKALQPSQDRMDLTLCKGKTDQLEEIMDTMARLSASGQLRSSGRQHSSTADELIAFAAGNKRWSGKLLKYARQYAVQVKADFASYITDYNLSRDSASGRKK